MPSILSRQRLVFSTYIARSAKILLFDGKAWRGHVSEAAGSLQIIAKHLPPPAWALEIPAAVGPMLESNPDHQSPPIPQLLYSPTEAAKALGMSKSKLYALWKDKPEEAPPSFMIGGNRYVSVEALRRWIATQPVVRQATQ